MNSEITSKDRHIHTTQRPPRVHIVVVFGDNYEARKQIAIPKVEGDMAKTFEAMARAVPYSLDGMKYAVVIYQEEVIKFTADVFLWMCGLAADPSQKDPNWMGHPQVQDFFKGDRT